jgi:hypothetical protein
MFILIDGLPLQTGSPRSDTAELLTALRDARPDWRLEVAVRADRPPIDTDAIAELPVRPFRTPLPVAAENRPVLDRYYADWLDAQRPDWVLHTDLFEPEGLVPVYRARRARAAAILRELICPASATRLRALRAMDLLLASTPDVAADVVRLVGPDAPPVVDVRSAMCSRFGHATDWAATADRVGAGASAPGPRLAPSAAGSMGRAGTAVPVGSRRLRGGGGRRPG